MELNEQVGRRLRQLREERDLSLSALARRSGTGKATLSELEAGRRNPTLETLYALTTALGVPLSAALTDPRRPHDPADPGPPLSAVLTPGPARAGLSGEAVTAVLTERFEDAAAVTDVFRITIRSGARQESAAHIPGTEERLIVLGGTALVGDPRTPHTVRAGEHAHWAADTPHLYSAPHGDAQALLFVRYPLPPGADRPR